MLLRAGVQAGARVQARRGLPPARARRAPGDLRPAGVSERAAVRATQRELDAFRRKCYLNGSHAGYILYVSDPSQNEDAINAIRQALRDSKGPGNFRNLFLYSPNGKKDGVQVIPISEVAAKDEFLGIKDATRDDILAAHRVPPALLGIVPKNTGGFGAIGPAARVFVKNELEPLQNRCRELNEWIGDELVRFEPSAKGV